MVFSTQRRIMRYVAELCPSLNILSASHRARFILSIASLSHEDRVINSNELERVAPEPYVPKAAR